MTINKNKMKSKIQDCPSPTGSVLGDARAEATQDLDPAEDMAGRGQGRGTLKGLSFDQTIQQGDAPLETQPSQLFPEHPKLKPPRPLTEKEARAVKNYKEFQDVIKSGAFYTHPTKKDGLDATTYSEEQFNDQYGGDKKADFDPFNDVETYSKRKAPPQKELPKLEDIKLDKRFFPKELWGTIEGEEGEETKKYLRAVRAVQRERLDGMHNAAKANKGSKTKAQLVLEKMESAMGDGDIEDEHDRSDDEVEDEAYEDDEDGGDYNAEGYFNDGAEDSGDGEGGEDGF